MGKMNSLNKYIAWGLAQLVVFGIFSYFIWFFHLASPKDYEIPEDDWRFYSYTHMKESVKIGYVIIFFFVTLSVFLVIRLVSLNKRDGEVDYVNEIYFTVFSSLSCLLITALLVEILKYCFGVYRPDYLSRCDSLGEFSKWPFKNTCKDYPALKLIDGQKSLPSGHSALSFASIVYLNLYLFTIPISNSGCSRVNRHIFNFTFLLVTLVASALVCGSRIAENYHRLIDVIVGSIIGIICAIAVFSAYFDIKWSQLNSMTTNQVKLEDTFGKYTNEIKPVLEVSQREETPSTSKTERTSTQKVTVVDF